jgi:hypothetical protein
MFDWVTVSPKTAEHTLKVHRASELKYVRHHGQALPKPTIPASVYYLSPAFEPDGTVLRKTLDHVINLVKENSEWRMTVQLQKILKIR